jgi:uncharacterized membrane protein YkoI
MRRPTKLAVIAVAAVAAAGAGTGIAVASAGAGDDHEAPISGTDRDRASQVALEHTGGGSVTDTEIADEDSYYEVEVTLDDGSQVDVQLDRDFHVVGSDRDGSGEDERGNG